MKKRKKELFWKNCKKKVFKVLHWKCLIWAFLDWNFRRTIEVFQITSLEIVKMQCFFQNKINLHLETNVCVFLGECLKICKVSCKTKRFQIWVRKCLIWVLQTGIWKNFCRIWRQHPRLCQNAKFRSKQKMF